MSERTPTLTETSREAKRNPVFRYFLFSVILLLFACSIAIPGIYFSFWAIFTGDDLVRKVDGIPDLVSFKPVVLVSLTIALATIACGVYIFRIGLRNHRRNNGVMTVVMN